MAGGRRGGATLTRLATQTDRLTIWIDWSCRQRPLRYCENVSEFTNILTRVVQGDRKAADELLPLVYDAQTRGT
jgi:hypothetical protein